VLAKRLRELSFLNNGVRIRLKDERDGKEDDFSGAVASRALWTSSTPTKRCCTPQPSMRRARAQPIPTAAFPAPKSVWKWPCSGTMATTSKSCAFTNNIPQRDGGTHLTGLRAAMTRVIGKYIADNELAKKAKVKSRRRHARRPVRRADREGAEPKFSSQTKDKLVSSEVRAPVEDIVGKLLTDYWKKTPTTPRS
jgi:Type IIA topoisomerase (DNA gyrase/topo II, topoisomerase IV), B subunit